MGTEPDKGTVTGGAHLLEIQQVRQALDAGLRILCGNVTERIARTTLPVGVRNHLSVCVGTLRENIDLLLTLDRILLCTQCRDPFVAQRLDSRENRFCSQDCRNAFHNTVITPEAVDSSYDGGVREVQLLQKVVTFLGAKTRVQPVSTISKATDLPTTAVLAILEANTDTFEARNDKWKLKVEE